MPVGWGEEMATCVLRIRPQGVDRDALSEFFADTQGTLLSLYNMFSGGALEQFSVFVLGIMPYISASIISNSPYL